MTTGYTTGVSTGTVKDFRTFALQCARAFGACVMQRDDPFENPPELRELSTHYKKGLEKAERRLARVNAMTLQEAKEETKKQYVRALKQWEKSQEENKAAQERYTNMLEKVHAYVPPSPDHVEFKKFMIEQLEESIKFDVHFYTKPEKLAAKEWLRQEKEAAKWEVEYNTKYWQEEQDRVANANTWITRLYESLK